jgi:Fe2+ transport system protein B
MHEPPATSPGRRLLRDLRAGLRAGLQTFWVLARVMVPAYGITLVLQYVGVIAWLARAARPLMSLLGLPGDAALPLVVGYVLNIYAAVGSMRALHLSTHNLIVEGAVLQRSGMNAFAFGALRVIAGLAAAALAHLLMGLF